MDNDRIKDFIDSYKKDEKEIFTGLELYAHENDVPIIREDVKYFLRMLLGMQKIENILEIGTAIGYSALIMHDTLPNANIITVEDYEQRVKLAKENFIKYVNNQNKNIALNGLSFTQYDFSNIKLIHADAKDVLKSLVSIDYKADFIFLDAAKGQYPIWLDDIMKIMHKGSILLSDNIFKDEEVLESRFTIEKRQRCIHSRMREFLYAITHNDQLTSTLLNIGDGISVSIKNVD